jgi:glycosyltransferase involved in cell wall biosynthesis
MKVSAVIPTRNRPHSLARALGALARQTTPVAEVLVVDASDTPFDAASIDFPAATRLRVIGSPPSVCKQRNAGILAARGDYVLLCDDDIELPPTYVETLLRYIASTNAEAVSGLWLQKNAAGEWTHEYPITSFRHLLWTYVFQLSVWGNIERAEPGPILAWAYRRIAAHYRTRGNDVSRAGWPILTQFESDVIRTRVYSLGACMVRRQSLLAAPFDETLDPHGLGDNYGVAIALPEKLHVLKSISVHHHLAAENRLAPELAFYRRVLALHYFLTIQATLTARICLVWSLIGILLASLFGDRARLGATLKAIRLILIGRNPYVTGRAQGHKCVAPGL